MSLERRISDALHAADDYEPSPDLFSRLHGSIEEDRAHRRRVRVAVGLVLLGAALTAGFLMAVAQPVVDGVTIPKWSLELVTTLALVAILLTLGPALRRLGRPLLDDIFHLSPPTGTRFSRLLDIAYYLFFGGSIVNAFDPTRLDRAIKISGDDVLVEIYQVASFLLQLGVAHTANLVVLPVIGLLFTSLFRRVARRASGADSPPESATARRADRLASGIVMTATLLAIGGALILVAAVLIALGLDG